MMEKDKEKQGDIKFRLPNPSSVDLRGRQSVRATFRLSEACIHTITILAAQLGIKQKSVFDHLMEDAQILKDMARGLTNRELDRQKNRIQKTFVLSRRSLSFLDSISNEYDTPRDALVEYSVRRLMPVIAKERKKHEERKKLLTEISDHFAEAENLLTRAYEELGTDDPVIDRLETAVSVYRNAVNDMAKFIEKGKMIEKFQPE